MGLFIPTYFAPISQYAAMEQSDTIVFELDDNFQKQSYRNRCYIFGANGKQLLNVPLKHPVSSERKKTKDAQVDNSVTWQLQHLKSLQAAYRNSPFFEFYIDDLQPVFEKKFTFLHDLTLETHQILTEALVLEKTYSTSSNYQIAPAMPDFRFLATAKKEKTLVMEPYIQLFDTVHGFLPNLSILDLLFMEGPNALNLLGKITLPTSA